MIRLSTLLLFGIPPVLAVYLAYSLYIPSSFSTIPAALNTFAQKTLNFDLQIPLPVQTHTDPRKADGYLSDPREFRRKIVAVGDLHGDFPNAKRVLEMTRVVDDKGDWTGDVDYFVQTGDIIDR